MNPTIKDVAKKANVSIATVSRVLNNLTGYSDKTKQKVLRTIEEMGYQPNMIARGLINKRTRTIGVLFPNVSSSFSSALLHGIEEFAYNHNYSVVVCNTDEDGKRTLKCLQVLREKQVDGIVFASELLKDEYYKVLEAIQIPVVLVSSETNYPGVPYVKVDDRVAAYEATEYLIHKGHKRIAMIGGTKGDPIAGVPRVEGYMKALKDHGIPCMEEYIAYGDFGFASGCSAMEELLKRSLDFTAVFAASDEMAIGVLSVAARRGIRVPDELSVIGYDNVELAEMVVPPLTTVNQPLNEMGSNACEKLIDMIETGKISQNSIAQHHIVERQTVRALD
ncbi:LacI family transcriptional regulator [Paenibacillus zeisoli]|uniref:LacI family transcriptional regulator n=1 Tax=Paenibacillus zeisoli TaxID=2496267 RepID=A0A433XCI5_9BACL|nr:LacI family DNA-binding transcriptional regulator [Paenibacillus zeisoli]RUT31588.1 LacI family transcriptional regulator [Paenibacillus zeisoli]